MNKHNKTLSSSENNLQSLGKEKPHLASGMTSEPINEPRREIINDKEKKISYFDENNIDCDETDTYDEDDALTVANVADIKDLSKTEKPIEEFESKSKEVVDKSINDYDKKRK